MRAQQLRQTYDTERLDCGPTLACNPAAEQVYRAQHVATARQVAVKVISKDREDTAREHHLLNLRQEVRDVPHTACACISLTGCSSRVVTSQTAFLQQHHVLRRSAATSSVLLPPPALAFNACTTLHVCGAIHSRGQCTGTAACCHSSGPAGLQSTMTAINY